MKSNESNVTNRNKNKAGASIEELGLKVVDNDNAQVSLARPVRHIRRVAEI